MNCREKTLDLSQAVVMGILNITPDSFYDGGKHSSLEMMREYVATMVDEGASIIDIGAVSTRPGAADIAEETEKSRLGPVLEMLVRDFPDLLISVDTYRASIAAWSVDKGAHMINDISGGRFDPEMQETIANLDVPYVMMHIKGTPGNMQDNPKYEDVIKEIKDFFAEQISKFKALNFDKIILDPGFGFGKTLDHNYIILKNLKSFKSLGYPLMAGMSRKSMINKLLGTKPGTALNGTTVVNTLALQNGADILRVHDVQEATQAIRILQKLSEL